MGRGKLQDGRGGIGESVGGMGERWEGERGGDGVYM